MQDVASAKGAIVEVSDAADEKLQRRVLDCLAEFAAGAGHELNNPLAIISAIAQRRLQSETEPSIRRDLSKIIEQTKRAYEMIADVRAFARPPRAEISSLNVREFFEDWVGRETRRLDQKDVRIILDAPMENVLIDVDEAILSAILEALSKNASEAIAYSGSLRFFCSVEKDEGQCSSTVELGVEDDGPGISEETRQLIFAPYYSGRQAGRGLGFGLSKAMRFSETLGARLYCNKAKTFSTGCRWSIELPGRAAS